VTRDTTEPAARRRPEPGPAPDAPGTAGPRADRAPGNCCEDGEEGQGPGPASHPVPAG